MPDLNLIVFFPKQIYLLHLTGFFYGRVCSPKQIIFRSLNNKFNKPLLDQTVPPFLS